MSKCHHWDIEKNMPDQSGKVAIVTGGNTGLGKELVRQLARRGAAVYMASRTESRARSAIEELLAEHPEIKEKGGRIEFLHLDLCNLKNCREAAQSFLEKEKRLDILINNAGIMATPADLTADGLEIQFQSNYLGHYTFTMPLVPILIETSKTSSEPVRVVQVTSTGHAFAAKDVHFNSVSSVNDDLGSAWRRYGRSKLANILFARSLSSDIERRDPTARIVSTAVHPGVVRTELLRGVGQSHPIAAPIMNVFFEAVKVSPYKGAITPLYAATAASMEEGRGTYFVPYAKRETPSKQALNDELAEELWRFSEEIVREKCGPM